jgi:serine/threonine protein kinase
VDFWALGIMFVQMLCGEQLDFHSQMFADNDVTTEPLNIIENLELPRHISPEAHSCVTGLLEINPAKRLGSPNSPHGLIRDHPFFNAGRRIDWQEVEVGLFKSIYKNQTVR